LGRVRFALAVSMTAAVLALPHAVQAAEAPKARVDGVADRKLRGLLEKAVGTTKNPPQSRFESRRRAVTAGEAIVAMLRSEGYYGYDVQPDVADDDANTPIVKVDPGKRFTFDDPEIEYVATQPEARAQIAAEQIMGLTIGAPGRAAEVLGAEGRIVASLQKRGYADVKTADRKVTVDHAIDTVQPTFRIDTGPLVRMDGLLLEKPGRTRTAWLDGLTPWKKGDRYDPDQVAKLERRLRDTGVYDSVTVALAGPDKVDAEGQRPVILSLADRKPHSLEVGAGYSTSEGVSLDARWISYNRLQRADTLTVLGQLAQINSKLDVQLSLPHWGKPDQTLTLGAGPYADNTDAYDDTGVGVRADITQRWGKTSYFTYGATLDYARTADKVSVGNVVTRGLDRNVLTATVLAAVAYDRSNDPLNPIRGWRVEGRVEPTYMTGDVQLPYLKVQTQGSVYFPFDPKGNTVIAGRLKVGSILGGTIPEVPGNRRFYAGGGGSVRGYAWQAIGPRLSDNTPQGGLSLVETSVELRRKIVGQWSGVAFIDAGQVGLHALPDGKDLATGAGFGVRYDLGFGPIRADIAVPLNKRQGDPAFQIYLSIGQAF
jgi:translocation and assembly module TamA